MYFSHHNGIFFKIFLVFYGRYGYISRIFNKLNYCFLQPYFTPES